MKTSIIDFVLVSASVLLLLACSALAVWFTPLSGAYWVLANFAIFLLAYGVLSMLFLAALRKLTPYPMGTFRMDSRAFVYWKLNAVLVDLATKATNPFSTVFTQSLLHSGFGAKIGRQVAIAGVLRDHPLLEIGDYATIGQNCVITAHAITHDEIVLKPVRIGRGAVVGINCVVMPGFDLGDHAVLAPGAVAVVDTKIPPGELWGGIPARRLKDLRVPVPELADAP
jgi:acetyltransferase-like isoleucine patch superfamily enzyme